MWWRASVAYNVLLELIYLACGANAEQLLCSCCSGSDVCHTELLGKDTGFRSACGPLWLNAQQTFRYVRSALMMRMFSRHELVFPAPFHVSHTFDRWLQIFLVFFCIFCLIAFESKRQIPHFISKLKHIILKSTPVLKCDRKLTIKLNLVFSPRCFFWTGIQPSLHSHCSHGVTVSDTAVSPLRQKEKEMLRYAAWSSPDSRETQLMTRRWT